MSQTALQKMLQEVVMLTEQDEFRGKSGSFGQRRSPIGSPCPPEDVTSNDGNKHFIKNESMNNSF